MKKLLLILALTFSTVLLAKEGKEAIKNLTLTNNYQVTSYKDIFFGGQPTEEQLKAMKKQGFATVISLRTSEEDAGYDEAKAAKASGLQYINIPISGARAMTPAKVDEITQAVVKSRSNGRVLVHCASGGRVGLWAGTHFHKDHKYSQKEAQAVAEKIGMPARFADQLLSNIKSASETSSE